MIQFCKDSMGQSKRQVERRCFIADLGIGFEMRVCLRWSGGCEPGFLISNSTYQMAAELYAAVGGSKVFS